MDLNPMLVALAFVFAMGLGVIALCLLWQVEHPNTRFRSWLRCTVGDGHLAGTREQNGGHRCIWCNEPLSFEEIARVIHYPVETPTQNQRHLG